MSATRPMDREDTRLRIVQWLNNGHRGASSEAILWSAMMRQPVRAHRHPLDPSDLRRCLLLLQQVPEAREGIGILAGASARWEALAREWDGLEESLRKEAGPELEGETAPRTYALMRALLDPLRGGNALTVRAGFGVEDIDPNGQLDWEEDGTVLHEDFAQAFSRAFHRLLPPG